MLLSIQSLLAEPNPDDPLNNEAAAERKSNKMAAESNAK
jgi:ubiquitin-protein ligase